MNIPNTPCPTLKFIRAERMKAVARCEHSEVMRRDHEEREHLDKCIHCAASIEPLYLQLWSNAKIGVDLYVTTN
jgi:hypothetical protein